MVEDGAEFRLRWGVKVSIGGWSEGSDSVQNSHGYSYWNAAGTVDEATFHIILHLIIIVFRLASSDDLALRSGAKYEEPHNVLGQIADPSRGKILGFIEFGMIGVATTCQVRGSISMDLHYYGPFPAPTYSKKSPINIPREVR